MNQPVWRFATVLLFQQIQPSKCGWGHFWGHELFCGLRIPCAAIVFDASLIAPAPRFKKTNRSRVAGHVSLPLGKLMLPKPVGRNMFPEVEIERLDQK